MKIVDFLVEHQNNIAEIIAYSIALLMVIFRMFPTEKGEGFLAKVDKWFNKALDLLKIPNPVKKEKKDE